MNRGGDRQIFRQPVAQRQHVRRAQHDHRERHLRGQVRPRGGGREREEEDDAGADFFLDDRGLAVREPGNDAHRIVVLGNVEFKAFVNLHRVQQLRAVVRIFKVGHHGMRQLIGGEGDGGRKLFVIADARRFAPGRADLRRQEFYARVAEVQVVIFGVGQVAKKYDQTHSRAHLLFQPLGRGPWQFCDVGNHNRLIVQQIFFTEAVLRHRFAHDHTLLFGILRIARRERVPQVAGLVRERIVVALIFAVH